MTGAVANPFVADRVDTTTIWTGNWIAEDIIALTSAYEHGDWIDGVIGGFGASMDALALVFDPIGTVVAMGIAWIIEQVKPLSDVLDWLAGDPDQITAYARTWRNIAAGVAEAASELAREAERELASWVGPTAEAYRFLVKEHCGRLATASLAIGLLGTFVEGAGLIVSLLRALVRDAIATFVSILLVRLPEWIGLTAGTLGIATPWVAGKVGTLVAQWSAKIARLLRGMIATIRRMIPMNRELGAAMDALRGQRGGTGAAPAPAARGADPAAPPPPDPRTGPDGDPPPPRAAEDEAQRVHELGMDPSTGRHRPAESHTAVRIEAEQGVQLRRAGARDPYDWLDQSGATYDAVGNFPHWAFERQWPNLQLRIVDHLNKADFVPIDVSQFTREQVQLIKEFTRSLEPRVFLVGERWGA